ncbi:MAG: response regulator [Thermodesulfobacteriota bacterium]
MDEGGAYLEKLSGMLDAARVKTVTLTNPLEVVPTLKRAEEMGNPLQLLLITLPSHDSKSYDAAAEVRRLGGAYARPPVVGLSRVTELDAIKSEKAGFDTVLSLPVRSRTLYETLLNLLGRGSVFGSLSGDSAQGLSILLADDDRATMKLTRYLLTKAGHTVEEAKNGTEAVRRFTGSPGAFDLILMDVEMPEMDGYEATQAIRERGFEEVPIIALTAHAQQEDHDRCLKAGMNDFITKPITQVNLLAAVAKWSGKR